MTCPESLRIQAYLDGEASDATAIESHLENCRECAQQREDILTLRSAIRSSATYYRADAALRRRVLRRLDETSNRTRLPGWMSRGFWTGAASGALATACAAALALALLLPPQSSELADDVLSAHLRSLVGSHLIDVASSNRHTV